jgi:hypothetical protein
VRIGFILAGAASAAVLFSGAAVARVAWDPVVRDCAGALAAADDAIAAHEYALDVLDRETYRRRVINEAAKQRAVEEADRAAKARQAAQADVARVCHYDPAAPAAEGGARGHLG